MNLSTFLSLRMANQQLNVHDKTSIQELVSYMGIMQAQDFAMSKWAVGMRLENASEHSVEAAINKAEIIRIHVLRPTWHFVAADDVHLMLQLSAQPIKASMKGRHKQMGLTEALFKKSNKIIERALSKKHCTREELMKDLIKQKIVVTENRSSHIMLRAELDGIVCSGEISNNKFTYALLDERINNKKHYSKEEALQLLATKYFQSHGPAKLSDFMWWCGINKTTATHAVSVLDKSFVKESFKKETYWLKQESKTSGLSNVLLLPSYDEYIISYKDRSQMVDNAASKKVISSNGIFWPVVLVNGKVAGKWSRKIINNEVKINYDLFSPVSSSAKRKLKKSASQYAKFINKKI